MCADITLKGLGRLQRVCGGDQHGLQDRLDRQRGPERPLSAEFVACTEPLLGQSLWFTLNTRKQAENVVLIWKLFRMWLKLLKNEAQMRHSFPSWACVPHEHFIPAEGRLGISKSQEAPGVVVSLEHCYRRLK